MNLRLMLGLLLVTLGTVGIVFSDAGVLIGLFSFVVIGGAWLVYTGFQGRRPH